eukprot:660409-Amphidinium_carterae.1
MPSILCSRLFKTSISKIRHTTTPTVSVTQKVGVHLSLSDSLDCDFCSFRIMHGALNSSKGPSACLSGNY